MIVVKLMGGLGNQMFQYALGRALAISMNTDLGLDVSFLKDRTLREGFTYRDFKLDLFHIKAKVLESKEVNYLLGKDTSIKANFKFGFRYFFNRCVHICEPSQSYILYKNVFESGKNVYLEGYWQNEAYFNEYQQTIRQDFVIKEEFRLADSSNIENLIISNTAVSVHFRRGDYVTSNSANQFHGLCSLDYYKNAVRLIAERVKNPCFFIFSDDIAWVETNIHLEYPVFFVSSMGQLPDYEDMRLMSCCKHHIIANSSFSWWAAWLNSDPNKIVVSPRRWFADPTIDTSQIVPREWLMI